MRVTRIARRPVAVPPITESGHQIEQYADAVTEAERSPNVCTAWRVAVTRSALSSLMADEHWQKTESALSAITSMDRRARQALARTKARAIPDFEALRDTHGASSGQWWWTPTAWVADSHEARTQFVILVCWGLTLAITSETIRRWLVVGPDWTSTAAIVVQAILALLGGAAFIEKGQRGFQRLAAAACQSIGRWQHTAILVSATVLASALAMRMALPAVAKLYRQQGMNYFDAGRLTDALDNWRLSASLDPDPWEVHYQLGSGLERLADTDRAIVEYRLAAASPNAPDFVANNLARLYLTQKSDPGAALALLEPALRRHEGDDVVRYRMLVNRGAAYLALKLPSLSSFDARAALVLSRQLRWDAAPSAACLLALSLDSTATEPLASLWRDCIKKSKDDEVSDLRWLAIASEKLSKAANENPP